MQTTTTDALAAAFVTAIHAITPRHAHERSTRWKHTPGDRERGQARHLLGAELRSFDLIWEPGAPSYLWFGTGTAYAARLRIAVSYRGVPPELREHVITADGIDLRRALHQLGEPTTPGLSHIVHEPVAANEQDDDANAYVEHAFRVHWNQDTNAA